MDEAQIGDSVRQHREAALQSQAELAKAMRERGPKWSQATVWAVEKGERPLRYSEALHLAELIGLPLTGPSDPYASAVERGVRLSISILSRTVKEFGSAEEFAEKELAKYSRSEVS